MAWMRGGKALYIYGTYHGEGGGIVQELVMSSLQGALPCPSCTHWVITPISLLNAKATIK